MNMLRAVNDNVVFESINVFPTGWVKLPDDMFSGDEYEECLYNVGVGKVVSSSDKRFEVGSSIVYLRSLEQKLYDNLAVIKSYRVVGFYEGN